jgi:hypothetical protein
VNTFENRETSYLFGVSLPPIKKVSIPIVIIIKPNSSNTPENVLRLDVRKKFVNSKIRLKNRGSLFKILFFSLCITETSQYFN